ncbi:MAG: hypothetical protein ACM3KD_03770 [Hyphomicrobiaceae bacterium]
MNRSTSFRFVSRALAVAAVVSLAACGGGGGGDGGVSSLGGLIGGTGFKGPVAGATVTAYSLNGGVVGAQIGTAKTDANGNFSVSIGSYAGPLMLQLSAGSYTDEASGSTMPMVAGDVMTAVLPTVGANATISGVRITPLTSMAQTMAQHLSGGMTDANITSANAAVGTYFQVGDILHMQPMNPLVGGAGSAASQDAINYGMAMAAMSQYAKGLGMASSSAMVTAMMSDASDGIMDGMMGTGPVMMGGMGMGMAMPASTGTSGLASAMSTFVASAQNKSGVTLTMMQSLINRLNSSNGRLFGSGPPAVNGMMRGTAFDGSVRQATVTAYAVNNGGMGAQLSSATTDANGNFSLSIGSYAGPVMLQVTGASYVDEATATTMTMAAGNMMTAVVPTVAAGATTDGLWVTPLTSMAQARAQAMSGGMMDANVAAANTSIGTYFMVSDILHVPPINTQLMGAAASATQDMLNYGMMIAAMSQYAKNINMAVSSSFIMAMMNDASDGMMDGKMGSTAISMPMGGMMGGSTMMQASAGTSGLANAMSNFLGSSANLCGATMTDMAALMQKLISSGGQLP